MLDLKISIESVKGFRVAGIHGGLKADNTLDTALILADRPCATGAVFTTNRVKAAPVLLGQQRLKDGAGRFALSSSIPNAPMPRQVRRASPTRRR